jgi:hypothetical protein
MTMGYRIAIAVTALALGAAAAIQGVNIEQYVPRFAPLDLLQLALGIALAVLLARPAQQTERLIAATAVEGFIIGLGVALYCGMFAVFIANPQSFARLTAEDGPVEWASALLLLAAALAAAGVLAKKLAKAGIAGRSLLLLAAPLSLAIFSGFVAMEEISWGQRLFGWTTPDWMMVRNQQGESNLHNFDTSISEVIYHGMLVLVIVGLWLWLKADSRVRPGTATLVLIILSASFNRELFNNVVVQLSLLLALAVAGCAALAAFSHRRPYEARLMAAVFGLLLVGQVLTVATGERFVRHVDNEEAKELLLAMALGWWTLECATRTALAHRIER